MGNFFTDAWEGTMSFFGLGKEGGRSDAFADYQRYASDVGGYIDRARANYASYASNPYVSQLTQSYGGLKDAMAQAYNQGVSGIREATQGLTSQLRGSALANTAGAQQSATSMARMAAGGRGGLAFGGGAGAIASRAGQEASVAQSSALAQAMLGAGQLRLQAEQGIAGLGQQYMQNRMGLASSMSEARMRQAALFGQDIDRRMSMDLAQANARLSLAGAGLSGGLQGEQAAGNRRTQFGMGMLGFN